MPIDKHYNDSTLFSVDQIVQTELVYKLGHQKHNLITHSIIINIDDKWQTQ